MQKQKHIPLIGICGTAMASLAGMLQQPFTSGAASLYGQFLPTREPLVVVGLEQRGIERRLAHES